MTTARQELVNMKRCLIFIEVVSAGLKQRSIAADAE